MSFLSGIASAGRYIASAFTGNGLGSTLVKTAALGYAVNQFQDEVKKANDANNAKNIDEGVRLQIPPANDNKIPVLYGSAYFGGIISDAEMTADNKTMYYAVTLSEKTGVKLSNSTATSYTFNDVYWNNQRVVFENDGVTVKHSVDRQGNIDPSLKGKVEIYFYAGSSSDGIAPENYTATVPNAADVMPNWAPTTHTMTDLLFAIVKVDYDRDNDITGIGDLVFQVSSDMFKPGDVLHDYMTNTLYGAGIETTNLNTSKLTELNTYSAESVSYTDEASGPATLANRYQINGVLDTSESALSNAEKIANSAATWISYDVHEGEWTFVINKADSSVASFSDSNILGNISLAGTGITELYNSVKVEFPHRDLRDSADFVGISIPASDRLRNEVDNRLNLSYDIINEPVQAEQLGLIELKQGRIDLMIEFQADYSYIALNAGDVIDVTNSRYGYTNKMFRIINVEELQDDDGALRVNITALEYDANVYDISDITRFTRTDENGIITIGAIGIPGLPQVTKIEQDSRPRVVIETTTPTGIVDALEYWISNDVTLAEENRSYRLLTTRKPSESQTFPSGTAVKIEVDTITSSDFLIKIRGVNNLTVGPYTDPSGIIQYRPVQATDAITPDTSVLDQFGNVALALTAIDLLKGLDGIYENFAGESLFDAIFDKFQEATGVDIVGFFGGNAPTYALTANPRILQPGANVLITLLTSNVADGTDVPYTITGVNTFEISGASLTGNFTVNNNTATLLVDSDGSIADQTVMTVTLDNEAVDVEVTFSNTAISYDVATFDEGTEIEENTKSYNFVGDSVEATNDGNGNITVTLSGGSGSDILTYDEGVLRTNQTKSYNFVGEQFDAFEDGNGNVTIVHSPTLVPSDDLIPLTPLGSPIYNPTINTEPCDDGSQLPPAFYIGELPPSDYKAADYVPGNVINCFSYSGTFGPALNFENSTWEGIIERKLFITG